MHREKKRWFVRAMVVIGLMLAISMNVAAKDADPNASNEEAEASLFAEDIAEDPKEGTNEVSTESIIKDQTEDINGKVQELQIGEQEQKSAEDQLDTSVENQICLRGFSWIDHGDSLDVGAAYDSGSSDVEFRWIAYSLSTKEWFLVSDWQAGNWITFVPQMGGGYLLQVQAKASADQEATVVDTMGYVAQELTVNIVGLCVQEQKESVDVGAGFNSNDPQVEFQGLIYDLKNRVWTVFRDWESGNWMSWTPAASGDYWIQIQARTRRSIVAESAFTIGYRVNSASITSFSTDLKSPQWQDATIRLKGHVSNQANQIITEQYLVYDGNEWGLLDSDADGSVWNPGKLGNYLLCYQILDADGNCIEQRFLGYAIEEPRMSMRGIYVRKDDEKRYAMAVAVDTNDPYAQYKWQYYDLSSHRWNVIADWGNNQSVSWIAPHAGAYWLHVEGRAHGLETVEYTIGYTVTQFFTDRIGFFSTISTNDANGTYNMMRALSQFNGIVINPGESLSFNATTGYCGPAQGYLLAGVVGGLGYGGGICQSATTLYGGFIRAGLTIIQRQNHSIFPTYVPIGLDAMIDFGSSDLIVRNDLGFPVKIITSTTGNILYVQVFGNTTDWYDSIEPSSWMTGSRTASASRTYYKNGKAVYTQALPNSSY